MIDSLATVEISSAGTPRLSANHSAVSIVCWWSCRSGARLAIVGATAQRPVGEKQLLGLLDHDSERGIFGHCPEAFQHFRAASRMRQKSTVTQGVCRFFKVATALFLKEQTDQIDDSLACFVNVRAQVLGAEILGDLHHTLRPVVDNGGNFRVGQDAGADAENERTFEKRSVVENGELAVVVGHGRSDVCG
jgi:hypothetical protein